MTLPRYRWQAEAVDGTATAAAARLAAALNIHPVVATLLCQRGFADPDAAAAFLHGPGQFHDPFLLKEMEPAAAAVWRAVDAGKRVLVYGDYDADGLAATALLTAVLRGAGAAVDYQVPHRLDEGYGLSAGAVAAAAAAGYGLLITVDCGITAVAEAEQARELGLPLVITDHHEPGPVLPPAVAVVNPHRPDCAYPDKTLSGTGVAYKLAEAIARTAPDPALAESLAELVAAQLDLVALGTVADVMPLTGENRWFVRRGLQQLSTAPRAGLQALLTAPGGTAGTVTEDDLAFTIAPRLNAAGRLGRLPPAHGVDLLLADAGAAGPLAAALEAENRRRQELEAELTEAALAQAGEQLAANPEAPVLVLRDETWPLGILGTVASRVLERTGRPVALLGKDGDVWRGSGRGPDSADWAAWLQACSAWLEQHGGHRQAAGFAVRPEHLDRFTQALADAVSASGTGAQSPVLTVDSWLDRRDLSLPLARQLRLLAPFGPGNPEPVFGWQGAHVMGARQVGKQRNHLKLRLQDSTRRGAVDAIGFKMAADAAAIPAQGARVDVAFYLRVNEWQGRSQVDLHLRDLMPAAAAAAGACGADDASPAPVAAAPVVVAERRRPWPGQAQPTDPWPAALADAAADRLWELPLPASARLSPVAVVVDRRGADAATERVSTSQAVWVCGTLEQVTAVARLLPQAAVWPGERGVGMPSPSDFADSGAGAARHWVIPYGALAALPGRARTKPAVLLAPPPTWDTWLQLSAGRAVELAFGPDDAAAQRLALAAYAPDRNVLAACYAALRAALPPRSDIRAADWPRLLAEWPAATWRVAVTVFRELGFIVPAGAALHWRPATRRVELTDSPTYRTRRTIIEESERLSAYFLDISAPALQAATVAGAHPLAGAG